MENVDNMQAALADRFGSEEGNKSVICDGEAALKGDESAAQQVAAFTAWMHLA